FRPVIPAHKSLVCLLTKRASVFSLMSKRGPSELGVAINYAANVHRQIKPLVRIEGDRIRQIHTCEQFSCRFREHGTRAITSIHVHPELEAVRNLSNVR